MKLVSAIITTNNRLELLKRAIESVRTQTYSNMECIVVDDASTDGTYEYCQGQPVRYLYIPPEESKGGNYARNRGIEMAQGEYVAFWTMMIAGCLRKRQSRSGCWKKNVVDWYIVT